MLLCCFSELGNTISTLFGGGSSEPAPNVTEPVQVRVRLHMIPFTLFGKAQIMCRRAPCGPGPRLQPTFFHGQDEEEVPPESAKEGKEEEGKDEAPKEEAPKDTQEDAEKSAGEEKNQEKTEEAGSDADAKVRSCLNNVTSDLAVSVCI